MDPRAAGQRVLGLLEDEEAATLSGDETGPSVVAGDHAAAPVRRKEQLLELVIGAPAQGDVEIALGDQPHGVAHRARAADVALGDRAAEPLGVVRDGQVTGDQVRQGLEGEVERVDRAHAEAAGARHVEHARRVRRFGRGEIFEHRAEVPREHVHAEQHAEALGIAGAGRERRVLHRKRAGEHRQERRAVPELLLLSR